MKRLRWLWPFAFLLGSFAHGSATEDLEALLEAAREDKDMPGLRAAVRHPDGHIVSAAVGLADVEAGLPLDNAIGMPGGSTGKTFVAALTMLLVEDGTIALDDRASKYLSDEPWFERLPNADDITVRHLLTHTSGLSDYPGTVAFNSAMAWRVIRRGSAKFEPEELIGYVLDKRARFPAGQGYRYTDAGYLVLGRLIEAASGREYFELLGERILQPLQLDDIAFQDTSVLENIATGYTGGTRNLKKDGRMKFDPSSEWTGGGLVTTPTMLVRFMAALVDGRLLEPSSFKQMREAGLRDPKRPEIHYGFGLFVDNERNRIGHGGLWPGYRTHVTHFADTGLTIAVQANRDGRIELGRLVVRIAEQTTPRPAGASIVIRDARIWTGDALQPWADAIAIQGDEIRAVGSIADIEKLIDADTEVIEASGGMLLPGFIDSHVHFLDGGRTLAEVQLRDAATPEEFTRRIGAAVDQSAPDEWITGGTWDHHNWGGALPHRDWIDNVSPQNPVWLMRLDGHMGVANSVALTLAGIDAETPPVSGGEIVRDADGRPTGVLKDNAMRLMVEAIPAPTEAQLDAYLDSAMRYVASNGITTVHDMHDGSGNGWLNLATYRRAEQRGALITRIYAMTPLAEWQALRDYVEDHGRGTEWLKFGGVKGFMDGSLGSHTAAMLAPFTDTPGDSGFLLDSLDDIERWVSGADSAGLHVIVHAIGDKAIRDLLDIYFDVSKANGPRDRRFRMEHAQHIHPDDVSRFAIQGVIASMQPYHAIDDGRWAEQVIGAERAQTTYAFKSLLDSGAHVAFGSDWYVAPASPIEGIYAAVTRQTLDGAHPDGWVGHEKISVDQALRSFTAAGAYAGFDEDRKGMLRTGMLADMVLIDRDLTRIAPEAIRDARILKTIVGGRVVFSR